MHDRHTLLIFCGYLALPILQKISGIIHLYFVYLCCKNQISTYKTVAFVYVHCAFFTIIFNSENMYQNK